MSTISAGCHTVPLFIYIPTLFNSFTYSYVLHFTYDQFHGGECNIQESTIHDSLQNETSALMNDHSCINPFTNTYYGQTSYVTKKQCSNSHQPEHIDNGDASIAMSVPSLCNHKLGIRAMTGLVRSLGQESVIR